MTEQRHLIWSNYDLDYEDWRDDLEEDHPELTVDERMALMYEINNCLLYRTYKPGVRDSQIDLLKEKLYYGKAVRTDIRRAKHNSPENHTRDRILSVWEATSSPPTFFWQIFLCEAACKIMYNVLS